MDTNHAILCQHCGNPLPEDVSRNRRYCSGKCRVAAFRKRRREDNEQVSDMDIIKAINDSYQRIQAKRPPGYNHILIHKDDVLLLARNLRHNGYTIRRVRINGEKRNMMTATAQGLKITILISEFATPGHGFMW